MPSIVGFHTNDEKRCLKFVREDVVINYQDVQWLGFGMYFWDNLGNAKYWLGEKRRKHPKVAKWLIVQAEVDTSNLLDLADDEILGFLNQLWERYCEKKKCLKEQPLGKKIDMLFDFVDSLNVYKVIKGFGSYEWIIKADFLGDSRIVNNIKTIYCVRSGNNAIIYNREIKEVG